MQSGDGVHGRARATFDRWTLGPLVGRLDALRRWFLRALMPWSGWLAAAREARVAVVALSMVAFSCLATMVAPLALLALGPILLGVPHLLADVRYCIVRSGLHRSRALWLAGVPIGAVALGADLTIGLVAIGIAIAGSRASRRRRAVGLVLVGGLLVSMMFFERWIDLALLHVHNFVAVGLWLAWRERRGCWHLAALGLLGVCLAAIVLWPAPLGLTSLAPTSVPVRHYLVTLAPGLPEDVAIRLVLSFAFMQSVHYGLWLRVVPEEDRERRTPRTFRASLRALDRDVGWWLVRLTLLATIGLAIWAAVDLFGARIGYLRFARFHAVVELCIAALLLAEKRTIHPRPADRDGPPRKES